MLELAGPKALATGMEGLVENLENLWRFDLSRRLLELLAGRRRLKATLHDSLAHAAARLGDLTAAQSHIGDALRLEPRNKNFWSNKGWYHLMGGELAEAETALDRARKLAPKDAVVTGNITVLKYLKRHGGNYFDYLLRPLDRKLIDRYADHERWDRVDATCVDFNDCRMEAFAQSAFSKGGKTRSHLPNMVANLKTFFRFVARIDSSGTFVHEDIKRTVYVRRTGFALPDELARLGSLSIHDVYESLIGDESRNRMIVSDALSCLEKGGHPLILTERRAHLECLLQFLAPLTPNLVVLTGGMGQKQRKAAVANLQLEGTRLVLATGRYLGEGFDDDRLDTLFLALPISWKGTLAQYAGRLNRIRQEKQHIAFYDYVDGDVPMLRRMFERRRRGYQKLGYEVCGEPPRWRIDAVASGSIPKREGNDRRGSQGDDEKES
jgi:hypothetical protein